MSCCYSKSTFPLESQMVANGVAVTHERKTQGKIALFCNGLPRSTEEEEGLAGTV